MRGHCWGGDVLGAQGPECGLKLEETKPAESKSDGRVKASTLRELTLPGFAERSPSPSPGSMPAVSGDLLMPPGHLVDNPLLFASTSDSRL